jgi:hypothetical protein
LPGREWLFPAGLVVPAGRGADVLTETACTRVIIDQCSGARTRTNARGDSSGEPDPDLATVYLQASTITQTIVRNLLRQWGGYGTAMRLICPGYLGGAGPEVAALAGVAVLVERADAGTGETVMASHPPVAHVPTNQSAQALKRDLREAS